MADDKRQQPSSLGYGGTTEASPLLVSRDGANSAPAVTPGPGEEQEESRGGNPEMFKRLPVLLPALGIGIFMCALDQLLAVATYAKIGSDLHALNSTSWIATA